MLSSGSGDHLCSPLVALLWQWLFTVCVYWDFCTGDFSLSLPPFSGADSVFHQPPQLSVCCDGLLFVFQYWVLLTGSGDELCDLLPALARVVTYCLPTLHLPAFPVVVY
jgi:hypothetical protein